MKILGIDTATPVASVALVDEGALVWERSSPDFAPDPLRPPARANHAETLFALIQDLVRDVHLSWEELSAIAVTVGPGSFTGLRIGLSAAKGLAFGWDVPVVGVSTLLAVSYLAGTGWTGWICPLLDAKKGEVYTALFRQERESIHRAIEDLVARPEDALQRVFSMTRQDPCLFIGEGSKLYADRISSSLGSSASIAADAFGHSVAFGAASIGQQAVGDRPGGIAELLKPRYLRPAEAELDRNGAKKPDSDAHEPLTKTTP
jgi:tRNA threonylcarbamoyladenosine biosynthesis protein TsaB